LPMFTSFRRCSASWLRVLLIARPETMIDMSQAKFGKEIPFLVIKELFIKELLIKKEHPRSRPWLALSIDEELTNG